MIPLIFCCQQCKRCRRCRRAAGWLCFLDVGGAEDALGVWLFFFAFISFPFCFMMTLNSFPLSGLVQLRLMGELSGAVGNCSAMVLLVGSNSTMTAVNEKVPVLPVL